MSYSAEDVSALRAAIATGATRVRVRDEETEFRSLSDMQALLAVMEAEASATTTTVRRTVASYQGP